MIEKQRKIGVVYITSDVWVRPSAVVSMEGCHKGLFRIKLYTKIHLVSGKTLVVDKNIYAVQAALQEHGEH